MNESERILEAARALLVTETSERGFRIVAEDVGVDPSTLHAFVSGQTKRPKGAPRAAYLAYARKRSGSSGSQAATATGSADGPDRAGTSGEPPGLDATGPVVEVPLVLLAYWRGRVEEQIRTIGGVRQTISGVNQTVTGIGDSLVALQGMLDQATRGMSGFVESGVFPSVAELASILRPATPEERDDALSVLRAAEGTPAPAPAAADPAPRRGQRRAAG